MSKSLYLQNMNVKTHHGSKYEVVFGKREMKRNSAFATSVVSNGKSSRYTENLQN